MLNEFTPTGVSQQILLILHGHTTTVHEGTRQYQSFRTWESMITDKGIEPEQQMKCDISSSAKIEHAEMIFLWQP
ncbi:hypothetical protein POX96_19750 [Enterobacter ludwigii]|uniref:hypothetical protein n=1 Tax=Enterobacter ludwigii TaxID=299767 RepID=UPI002FFAE424